MGRRNPFFRRIEGRMIAAARHSFRMAATDTAGKAFAARMEQAAKAGIIPKPKPGPRMPRQAQHVWEWFLELNAARTGNGFGPNPITFQELKAWADLTGRNPKPMEVHWLKTLDRLWMTENATKRESDG